MVFPREIYRRAAPETLNSRNCEISRPRWGRCAFMRYEHSFHLLTNARTKVVKVDPSPRTAGFCLGVEVERRVRGRLRCLRERLNLQSRTNLALGILWRVSRLPLTRRAKSRTSSLRGTRYVAYLVGCSASYARAPH